MKAFESGKAQEQYFESLKKELWIDITRKFIVVNAGRDEEYKNGDICTLIRDENTHCPYFDIENWKKDVCIFWKELAYYEEETPKKSEMTVSYKQDDIIYWKDEISDWYAERTLERFEKDLAEKEEDVKRMRAILKTHKGLEFDVNNITTKKK